MKLDTGIIILLYVTLAISLISIYIYSSDKILIKDIVAILSGTTIALGLLNYVGAERERIKREENENKINYINNVSSIFNKIDNLYLENSDQLHDLFYEFYGYNSFPLNNLNNQNNNLIKSEKDKNEQNISSKEYIVINIIVEYLNNIFITNPEVYADLNFRNRIINYFNSNKLKKVLSYNKNNYSPEFIKALNINKFISTEEIAVESISIPKINKN
jgi:hypothetical protein